MVPARLFVLTFGLLTACTAVGETPSVPGSTVCKPEVETALDARGLSLTAMGDRRWFVDYFADADVLEEMQPISGYRFYGRPPECRDGAVAVSMWASCGVTDVRSVGACRIDGLDHTWF